jgi:CBS domain-containing protein
VPTATKRAATKSLLNLTAADLMISPVMTIPEGTSLRDAARLLSRTEITGAPVVDAAGRCIGVLSSSDFVTLAREEGQEVHFFAPWGEMISVEDAPDKEIRHYMTVQPICVPATTPVGALARKMVDAHIHRVLVAGDEGRACGIVTSTDVVAAVARASEKPPRKAER